MRGEPNWADTPTPPYYEHKTSAQQEAPVSPQQVVQSVVTGGEILRVLAPLEGGGIEFGQKRRDVRGDEQTTGLDTIEYRTKSCSVQEKAIWQGHDEYHDKYTKAVLEAPHRTGEHRRGCL